MTFGGNWSSPGVLAKALANALRTVFSLAPIFKFLVRYQTMNFASRAVAF